MVITDRKIENFKHKIKNATKPEQDVGKVLL